MDTGNKGDGRVSRRSPIRTFRDLIIWQKAMLFGTEIYKVTRTFPREEQLGLVSQLRRSSVSIRSNVAEGYGRKARGDYLRFLQVTMGSIFVVQTQLQIASNLDFLGPHVFETMFEKSRELERMLSALINRLSS